MEQGEGDTEGEDQAERDQAEGGVAPAYRYLTEVDAASIIHLARDNFEIIRSNRDARTKLKNFFSNAKTAVRKRQAETCASGSIIDTLQIDGQY